MNEKTSSDRVDRSPEGILELRYKITRHDHGVIAALEQYEKELRATYKFSSKGKIELMKRKIAQEIISTAEDAKLKEQVIQFGLEFYEKIERLKKDMTRVRSNAKGNRRRKLEK